MTTFARIVETGSLSAAARASRLSLAAVSRQLAALEAELGVSLVVRTTRRLQVTDAGRRWYAHGVRLLHDLDAARADLAADAAPRGRVVVSAPVTAGLAHVVPRLERLARRHPQLEVDLRLEDHVVDLVGDAVDLAVRAGVAPPDSASIIAHPLTHFRRVLVAAPAYLRRRGKPRHPHDLVHHDALVATSATRATPVWRFTRDGDTLEIQPRARLRCNAPLALRDWAAAGAGVAVLPAWLAGTLVPLLPDWSIPTVPLWALHRVELRTAPRLRAVLSALTDPTDA